jgi:hypothetical protein
VISAPGDTAYYWVPTTDIDYLWNKRLYRRYSMNIDAVTLNTKKIHPGSHKTDRNLEHAKQGIRSFAKRRVSCGVGAGQRRFEHQAPVVRIGR